jgi:hypothetical protein
MSRIAFSFVKYGIKNQSGNVAVVAAVCMTILVVMLVFVLDTGYLYSEKNRSQNAVEAAALAGAANLCGDDAIAIARDVARENGILDAYDTDIFVVQLGYFDECDEYEDFATFVDFQADPDPETPSINEAVSKPNGEAGYNNAVMVQLRKDVRPVAGGFLGQDRVTVSAAAVAYLQRHSLVSLGGEIRLKGNPLGSSYGSAAYRYGNIHSNGDIKLNGPPSFTGVDLVAHGQVMTCTTTSDWTGWNHWSSCGASGYAYAYPGSPQLDDIRPCDEAYVESLRAQADIVYDIDDVGSDNVLYGECAALVQPYHAYFFDLSQERASRQVIYFDAHGTDQSGRPIAAYLSALPTGCSSQISHSAPNGGSNTVRQVTFISRCPVIVSSAGSSWPPHFGGEGEDHVIVITAGDITVYYGNVWLEGVAFRCGGDFSMPGSHGSEDWENAMQSFYNRMRVIADGDIEIDYPIGKFDMLFGPPCPPVIQKFGLLQTATD